MVTAVENLPGWFCAVSPLVEYFMYILFRVSRGTPPAAAVARAPRSLSATLSVSHRSMTGLVISDGHRCRESPGLVLRCSASHGGIPPAAIHRQFTEFAAEVATASRGLFPLCPARRLLIGPSMLCSTQSRVGSAGAAHPPYARPISVRTRSNGCGLLPAGCRT
jgi:hypothetical protein